MKKIDEVLKKKVTRRSFLKGLGKAAVGTGLGLPLLSSCAQGDTELSIGYIPITDAAPLLAAHALGFFQEEGLKVKQPVLIRSWSGLVEAFLSGKVNVTHLLLPIPIWMRYKNRAPVKVVAWDHTNGSALTVSGESGIHSFTQLGGTQIAVPYWYSMHNIILQLGLNSFGLEPVIRPGGTELKPNQVNLVILPPPEMPSALSSGKIDGYIVAEPFNALGELKTGAKIMRFTGDIWKNHPCCVVVMKEQVINNNPIFTQKVVNSIVRAQQWLLDNRREAAKLLGTAGKAYLPVSEEVLLRVFTGYEEEIYGAPNIPTAIKHPEWDLHRINFQPYPYPSAARFIYQQLQQTLVEGENQFLFQQNPEFVSTDLIDDTFVKRAIQDFGGAGMFDQIDLDTPWEREEIISL